MKTIRIAKDTSGTTFTLKEDIINNYIVVPSDYDFVSKNSDDVTSFSTLLAFYSVERINYQLFRESLIKHVAPNFDSLSIEDKINLLYFNVAPNYITKQEITDLIGENEYDTILRKYDSFDQIRFDGIIIRGRRDFINNSVSVSGDIITLLPQIYIITNSVILNTYRLKFSESTVIEGVNDIADSIVYTGTSSMFINDGSSVQIRNCTLSAPTGRLFDFVDSGRTKNIVFDKLIISNSNKVGSFTGFKNINIMNSRFENNLDGMDFNDVKNLSITNINFDSSNSNTYINFSGGSFGVVTISDSIIEALSANTAVGINRADDAQIENGIIINNHFEGDGVEVVGITPNTNPDWVVDSNYSRTFNDFSALADLVITGNTTPTTFTATSTPTKVVGNSFTDVLRRFLNTNGRLTYIGSKKRMFELNTNFDVGSTGIANTYRFYIYKNGEQIRKTVSEIKLGDASNKLVVNVTITSLVELEVNDYIEVWVENVGSTTSIIVFDLNLIVKSLD